MVLALTDVHRAAELVLAVTFLQIAAPSNASSSVEHG
jgi:hypothetical protein